MTKNTSSHTRQVINLLDREAKKILDQNRTGSFTKPAAHLYPFQWSWDSAFITCGYAHYSQKKAEQELRHLFDAQWSNGMVPQIIFNDNDTAHQNEWISRIL